MSRSTTAVVLSALVLPGAGQLYLKHVWRGMALIGVSLGCLWIIVIQAMQQASAVLVELETEEGLLDATRIADVASQATSGAGSAAVSMATLVLIVCWVAGIIDAYRLGNRKDAHKLNQINQPTYRHNTRG